MALDSPLRLPPGSLTFPSKSPLDTTAFPRKAPGVPARERPEGRAPRPVNEIGWHVVGWHNACVPVDGIGMAGVEGEALAWSRRKRMANRSKSGSELLKLETFV